MNVLGLLLIVLGAILLWLAFSGHYVGVWQALSQPYTGGSALQPHLQAAS